jgi:acyl carrier protein
MSEIEKKILGILADRLDMLGINTSDVNKNDYLITTGILDSFSFLEFISDLEDQFSIEFDFGEMDPSEFTTIEALVSYIQKQNG